MSTINDFIDRTNPFLVVPEKFQIGIYTVRAEVYGSDYEQFPVIHVTSYELFNVTPEVEITGDIVFTDKGELVWISRIQVSVDGGTPIPFDAARYDFPEISALIMVYLTDIFNTVWTNEVGHLLAYHLRNKLARPIEARLSPIFSKVKAANSKIEEVEKLIASLPELIAARDALKVKEEEVRIQYRAGEKVYKEKVANLPPALEGETIIINPVHWVQPTAAVKEAEAEAVVKAKRWWQR